MSNILIGITGSIATYKMPELIRHLVKDDSHNVRVMLTKSAQRFVTELTLKNISKNTVYTDELEFLSQDLLHIDCATWADIMLIAPLTANTLAKISKGIADNLLTSTILAISKDTPLLLAPAMNTNMWENPLTQKNVKLIQQANVNNKFILPRRGKLACDIQGIGALAKIEDIYQALNENIK